MRFGDLPFLSPSGRCPPVRRMITGCVTFLPSSWRGGEVLGWNR
jgi:hypothetical protein